MSTSWLSSCLWRASLTGFFRMSSGSWGISSPYLSSNLVSPLILLPVLISNSALYFSCHSPIWCFRSSGLFCLWFRSYGALLVSLWSSAKAFLGSSLLAPLPRPPLPLPPPLVGGLSLVAFDWSSPLTRYYCFSIIISKLIIKIASNTNIKL